MTVKTGCWVATMHMKVDSGEYANVFLVRAPWDSDPADVAQDLATAYTDTGSFYEIQSDCLTYEGVTVMPADGESAGVVFDSSIMEHAAGSRSADMVAPQVAAVMTKRTNIGGPGGRGRSYIPGCTSEGLNDHETGWKSDSLAGMQGCAESFLEAIGSGSVTTGLMLPHGTSTAAFVVLSVQVRAYLGTIRRRAYQYR